MCKPVSLAASEMRDISGKVATDFAALHPGYARHRLRPDCDDLNGLTNLGLAERRREARREGGIMQLRMLASCAALSMFTAAPVMAQVNKSIEEIAVTVGELQAKELPELNEIQKDEEALAPKRKELKLWDNEMNSEKMHREAQVLEKEKAAFNKEHARLLAAIDAFNRSCVGRMPMAQYNVCAQKKAGLHAWNVKVAAKKVPLQKRYEITTNMSIISRRGEKLSSTISSSGKLPNDSIRLH